MGNCRLFVYRRTFQDGADISGRVANRDVTASMLGNVLLQVASDGLLLLATSAYAANMKTYANVRRVLDGGGLVVDNLVASKESVAGQP